MTGTAGRIQSAIAILPRISIYSSANLSPRSGTANPEDISRLTIEISGGRPICNLVKECYFAVIKKSTALNAANPILP
jgi:hypothetical protein